MYPDSFLVSLYVPVDDRRQASHRSSTPSRPRPPSPARRLGAPPRSRFSPTRSSLNSGPASAASATPSGASPPPTCAATFRSCAARASSTGLCALRSPKCARCSTPSPGRSADPSVVYCVLATTTLVPAMVQVRACAARVCPPDRPLSSGAAPLPRPSGSTGSRWRWWSTLWAW